MRIYVVRHGQSERNIGLTGDLDCRLSEQGHVEAQTVAETLARLGVTHIFSSPYCRTLQTAEAIRQATGAPAELLPAVHEYSAAPFPPGPWPLGTLDDIRGRFPHFAVPPGMGQTDWAVAGETTEQEWERLGSAVDRLMYRFAAEPDARLAVVTHQGPGYHFIKRFLRLEHPSVVALNLDTGSITVLGMTPKGTPALLCLNWRARLELA